MSFKSYAFLSAALLASSVVSLRASAQAVDAVMQQALGQTQALLGDAGQRQAAVEAGGADAQKANDFVGKITGGDAATSGAMYQLSGDVLGKLVEASGGDLEKLQANVADLQAHPENLQKYLGDANSKENQAIRSIAGQIEGGALARPAK